MTGHAQLGSGYIWSCNTVQRLKSRLLAGSSTFILGRLWWAFKYDVTVRTTETEVIDAGILLLTWPW